MDAPFFQFFSPSPRPQQDAAEEEPYAYQMRRPVPTRPYYNTRDMTADVSVLFNSGSNFSYALPEKEDEYREKENEAYGQNGRKSVERKKAHTQTEVRDGGEELEKRCVH